MVAGLTSWHCASPMAVPPNRLMHVTERTSVPPPQGVLHDCHAVRFQLGWIWAIEGEGVLGAGEVGAGVGEGVGIGGESGGSDFNTVSTDLPFSLKPLCNFV